ncbi:hypothetical protein JCGZ_09349 [Jatropha curcas]|uniref:Uncharacterized protein n=1 Tax=Jatropha curcas TaxID=180498 RepID=A0A067JC06_JATCU|nr:hypothetical protein JCGZ_09349 [Jatropha curcas]
MVLNVWEDNDEEWFNPVDGWVESEDDLIVNPITLNVWSSEEEERVALKTSFYDGPEYNDEEWFNHMDGWVESEHDLIVNPITLNVWSSEEEEEAKEVNNMTRSSRVYQLDMNKAKVAENEKASPSIKPEEDIKDDENKRRVEKEGSS